MLLACRPSNHCWQRLKRMGNFQHLENLCTRYTSIIVFFPHLWPHLYTVTENFFLNKVKIKVIGQVNIKFINCGMLLTIWFSLWWQCHYSYNACGLGSDGTDRLVNLVQEIQHRKTTRTGGPSLFGAKITGGGSGGSVCVIGKNCLRSSEEILEARFSILR